MRRILLIAAAVMTASLVGAKPPEDKQPEPPAPGEAAVVKGLAYLKSTQQANGSWRDCPGTTALALKAIVYTGVPPGYEATVSNAVQYLLANSKFSQTYETALLAMALQDLDSGKYREVIAKCAAYLHSAQMPHGMWTYHKVPANQWKAAQDQILSRQAESKTNSPHESLPGDNSNTQFALLGLRAARWAGVDVDVDVIRRAQEHFMQTQGEDGGWGYTEYTLRATGSMTCAGLGSLCILDDVFKSGGYFERRKIQKNNVAKGVQWMRDHFSIKGNPGGGMYYYYMYSMERAGILTNRKQFGEHDWYEEGVPALCATQKEDGSWAGDGGGRRSVESDTAFAILFLKKGARFNNAPLDIPVIDDL